MLGSALSQLARAHPKAGVAHTRRRSCFGETLADARHLVLVGSKAPVAFFACPAKPSTLSPPDCEVRTLAGPAKDVVGALEALGVLGTAAPLQAHEPPSMPEGALTPEGPRSGRYFRSGVESEANSRRVR